MAFYRPPVNPGWDDFGARIAQGVQSGIGLAVEGRQRRRDQRRQDDADRMARKDRDRRIQMENAEAGMIPEADAYETVPVRPSLSGAATGQPAPLVPDWMGSPDGQWRGEVHGMDGVDPSALAAFSGGGAPAAAPATERRLRSGVQQVGGLFIDPTRSLAFQRQRAAVNAEHAQDQADRERKRTEVRAALIASGMDPQNADRRAVAAAFGVTLPETPEERAERIRAEEEAREPYRVADDNRTFGRAMAIRAAVGDGSGGRGGTPSQRRAERNELRSTAEDSAYRVIRSDPTISEQELADYLRRSDVIGRDLSFNDIQNAIANAQSRYSREQGSGAGGQMRERGRVARSQQRQNEYVRNRGKTGGGQASPPPQQGGGAPRGGGAAPAAGRGGGAAKPAITQAEFQALKGRGFTDQQIRSRYTVQAR